MVLLHDISSYCALQLYEVSIALMVVNLQSEHEIVLQIIKGK